MSLQLDEIARLQADLDGGADRAAVLRDAGTDEASFRLAKLAMLESMAADLDRGDSTLVQRYAAAFVGRAGTYVEQDTPEPETQPTGAAATEPVREVELPSFLAQPAAVDRGSAGAAAPAPMPAPIGLAGTGFLDREKMLSGLKLPFRETPKTAPPAGSVAPAPPAPAAPAIPAPPAAAPVITAAPVVAAAPSPLSTGTMMSSGPLPLPAAALPFAGSPGTAPKPSVAPTPPAPAAPTAPKPASGVAFAIGVPTSGAVPATPGIGVTFMSPVAPRAAEPPPASMRQPSPPISPPPASLRQPPPQAPFGWTLEQYASYTVDIQLGARDQVLAAYRITVADQPTVDGYWQAALQDPQLRQRCAQLAEQYRVARYGR